MAYVVTRNPLRGLAGVKPHGRPRPRGARPASIPDGHLGSHPNRTGPSGHAGLGADSIPAALVTGDRVKIFQAQRNEARQLFGESNIPITGRTDVREPGLSPDYARKLLDYWIDDTSRVYAGQTTIQLIFETAIAKAYFDNLATMKSLRSEISGSFVPDSLMVRIWKSLSEAALTGFAIETTPKPWQLVVEAIHEAIDDLPKPPGLNDLATLLKWAVGGIVAVMVFQVYNARH